MSRLLGFAAAMLAAVGIVPSSGQAATTVQVLGAGSSAMFDTFAYSAWFDLAGPGAQHYTTRGSCPTLGFCAAIHDRRSGSIPRQSGSLWVVWSADESRVWAYIGADSVAGIRAFFAAPRATLQIDPSLETKPGLGLIPASLWGQDATALPSAVYSALNNAPFTTAFSDVRPEDAKAAQVRACSPLDPNNYSGLGYCASAGQAVGTPIHSAYSAAESTPVAFNLSGADPISGLPVRSYTAIDIGASPIVFFGNRTPGSSLASITTHDLSLANVQALFAQGDCDAQLLGGRGGITIVQNEPLSGAMITSEFTNFRLEANNFTSTQEFGVNPSATGGNPLNLPCGSSGRRTRAIGALEMVNTAILKTPDALGYALYSSGNFSRIANNPNFHYFTLEGVDPFCPSYGNGEIYQCGVVPHPHFPNILNGTYRSWAMLRAVTDTGGTNLANTSALVTATQNSVDCTTGDFVPAVPVSNNIQGCTVGPDPGLALYRSHYGNLDVPNNGLSGERESGRDAGGCIENIGPAPGVLNCRQ